MLMFQQEIEVMEYFDYNLNVNTGLDIAEMIWFVTKKEDILCESKNMQIIKNISIY